MSGRVTPPGVQRHLLYQNRPKAAVQSGKTTVRRGAKALIVEGDNVLLLSERRSDGSVFRSLPGGGVETGESLRECLRREVVEELQCRLKIDDPVGNCAYNHTTKVDTVTLYAVYTAEILDDPVANSAEGVCSWGWHPLGDLPRNLLSPFEELLSKTVCERDSGAP